MSPGQGCQRTAEGRTHDHRLVGTVVAWVAAARVGSVNRADNAKETTGEQWFSMCSAAWTSAPVSTMSRTWPPTAPECAVRLCPTPRPVCGQSSTGIDQHGRVLIVDRPDSIGVLPAAVARACDHEIAHLPGLAMRRIAYLHPGQARTDARMIAEAARPDEGHPPGAWSAGRSAQASRTGTTPHCLIK